MEKSINWVRRVGGAIFNCRNQEHLFDILLLRVSPKFQVKYISKEELNEIPVFNTISSDGTYSSLIGKDLGQSKKNCF